MTAEAKRWKKEAKRKLGARRRKLIEEPVELFVTFYLRYNRDVDNLKLLLDALEGTVIKNDRQVEALHVFKEKDRKNPRVVVELWRLEQ